MLYNLVIKDFLLVKKYLAFMLVASIGFSILLNAQIGDKVGGYLIFSMITLLLQFTAFNTVSMAEEKYRGAAMLCATPYRRNTLVIAKYLFLLVIFVWCYIAYTALSLISPLKIQMLDICSIGVSLLIITIYFGAIIPLQYYFGFEKTKYVTTFFIFITPFLFPYAVRWLQSSNINLQTLLPFSETVKDILPGLVALLLGFVSMVVTIKIYSKKNL